MNITFNDAIPWIIGGVGLMVAAHFLTNKTGTPPELSAESNTVDFPSFPEFGSDLARPEMVPSPEWPHPYAHPRIPRPVKGPAYFQNSIPLDETHYNNGEWQGQQIPPLYITVSQNMPTPETYSHHHMYFENEREPGPLENGILHNIR